MKRFSISLAITFVFASVFFGITNIPSVFAAYPQAIDDYVNDFAAVIKVGDKERLRKELANLEYQTGTEIAVVTINSTEEYASGLTTFENFATDLFNYWGIGHRAKNNGILILVAMQDRAVRIELGEAYPSSYDELMQNVINNDMLPYFRNGEYSRGIYEGTRGVVEKVTRKVPWYDFYKFHILLAVLGIAFGAIGFSLVRSGKRGWGWFFLTVVGFAFLFLLKWFILGRWRKGFGGGRSSGGGATGRW